MKFPSQVVRAVRLLLASRRLWKRLAGAAAGALLFLILLVAATPLPPVLRENHGADSSVQVLDRTGKVLAEVRADDGFRARWVPLAELGPTMVQAMVAAEDQRFYWHPGVDLVAIARAAGQNLWNRRIVSGASTLTQQLGRTLVPRPRTLFGKGREAVLALRIEASLSKRQILESYLNLVTFGPSLRGVEAASRFYFDKPTSALSVAEAATLAALPKGPTLYDPRRSPTALERRRNYILDRMLAQHAVTEEQLQRAKQEPIQLHGRPTGWSAPHLVRGLLSGAVDPQLGPLQGRSSVLHTTLDAELQRTAQTAARNAVRALAGRKVTAASVVVLDNETGQVLAWVGAHDFFDEQHFGQNDGVLAYRQPGSTLKPFVYGLAMQEFGWTAATVLPDLELHLNEAEGVYSPHNYDGRYHGPVRLREALANSYNVPAVYAASQLGPERLLQRLRELGFQGLEKNGAYYGAALALGDGEVRLIDLANAYATLARGGEMRPVRALLAAKDSKGASLQMPEGQGQKVMPESVAALLLDMLADPHARLSSFGAGSVLEMPFATAVKTGTSKGFRDNLTVGCTREVTVGVWVGNFDGSPMQGVSGISGAGPLFREVMLAAMRGRVPKGLEISHEPLETEEICALSGKRPTEACPHRIRERFAKGTGPEQSCEMHQRVLVDTRNGLRAGDDCDRSKVKEQVLESYSGRYLSWAIAAKRPLVPEHWSPLCSGGGQEPGARQESKLRLRYPYPDAVFSIDPSLTQSGQAIVFRAEAEPSIKRLWFILDGVTIGESGRPFEKVWPLVPGRHRIWVQGQEGQRSEAISFEVN